MTTSRLARTQALALLGTIGLLVAASACSRKSQSEPGGVEPVASAQESAPAAAVAAAAVVAPLSEAKVGEAAPNFELEDLDGNLVKLASFRGKPVVLEWFNPECPFVKASHTKGSLIDTAARAEKTGAVWLAINSGAQGKQGHGVEVNRAGKERFKLEHPVLLDEDGRVGHAYGAAHTPHMYVIDSAGVLVYRGAIDNSPDGEGDSPTGGKLVNYVDGALGSLSAGKPVSPAETEAYGCSVKYQK